MRQTLGIMIPSSISPLLVDGCSHLTCPSAWPSNLTRFLVFSFKHLRLPLHWPFPAFPPPWTSSKSPHSWFSCLILVSAQIPSWNSSRWATLDPFKWAILDPFQMDYYLSHLNLVIWSSLYSLSPWLFSFLWFISKFLTLQWEFNMNRWPRSYCLCSFLQEDENISHTVGMQ